MNAKNEVVEHSWRSNEVEEGVVEVVADWVAQGEARPSIRSGVAILLAENERLRSVLGHCPRGIAVLDVEGNLIGYNRELRNLLGSTPRLGDPLSQFFDSSDREILAQVTASARSDRRSAGVLRAASGRDVEFFAATLPGQDDDSIGIILAGEDRTATMRDDAERALLDEANAQTAFDVALSIVRNEIAGLLHTALLSLGESPPDPHTAREALRQAEAVLIRRTALPPPPEQAVESAGVAAAARRASRLALVGEARRRAIIQVSASEALRVQVPERHLTQILTNLIANGLHAIVAGAELGIVHVDGEEEGERVLVRVQDDGVGIEPAMLQNVFEPGVTTRPGAKGLGLAIARLLVERSGGAIRVVSEPGSGTTVTFDLPRAGRASR